MSVKLIFEPRIYLVGVQAVDNDGLREFLESRGAGGWTTDAPSAAEHLAEVAGRCCYDSFRSPRPGGNASYLDHILESKHGNIAEHAVFNFILSGVSRSLTHELIRHRAGVSVSQLSQRYVDSSDVSFVVPPALVDDVRRLAEWIESGDKGYPPGGLELADIWRNGVQESLWRYEELADGLLAKFSAIADKTARRKRSREAARSVLPSATETVVFVTANARALRHIFEQRGSIHADAEIRRLAVAWLKVVKPAAPNLFADCMVEPTDDGIGRIEVAYSKV